MITHRTKWLLVGLVCLALWPAHAPAQGGQWNTLNAVGMEAYQRGDYAEAEKQLAAAVKEAEGFGPQDPRLATSLNNLAEVYRLEGRYGKAEPLHRRALAIREVALGPEHPDVGTALNGLANLYRDQGRYAEAEPLFKRAVVIREKVLGPVHPHLAESLENYAVLLRKTGRDSEATKMETRAKAIRAKHAEQNPAK